MDTITRTTQVIERVPAHDLKVGDTIMVTALNGEYIGTITAIEEYAVFAPLPLGGFSRSEANSRCLCIRLPHLNTYRANFDTVRRVCTNLTR